MLQSMQMCIWNCDKGLESPCTIILAHYNASPHWIDPQFKHYLRLSPVPLWQGQVPRKKLRIPLGSRCPGTHLWCHWSYQSNAGVLLFTLDKRKVSVLLCFFHFQNEDGLETLSVAWCRKGRVSYLRSIGRGFESWLGRCQVVTTWMGDCQRTDW